MMNENAAFWTGLFGLLNTLAAHGAEIITAIGVLVTGILTWCNGRHLKRQDRMLETHEAKVDAVATQVVEAAKLRDETIDLIQTGAYRVGHVAGQEVGLQRAKTDFGALGNK